MAEAKKTTEEPVEGEVPKKKNKLLLMIVIAAAVVVLGGGGATYFLMKKGSGEEAEEGDEVPAKAAKAKKKKKEDVFAPPVFAKLEPFVVKLQAEQAEAYVQAVPELKLLEAPVADRIKAFMPEVRHKVLLILAGKKASDLSNPEGMQILANQIRAAINSTLTGDPVDPKARLDEVDPEAPVQAVFFSSLIVQ